MFRLAHLANAVHVLCSNAVLKCDNGICVAELLIALPMLHFLRGDSRPFENPEPFHWHNRDSRTWWGLGGIDLLVKKANVLRKQFDARYSSYCCLNKCLVSLDVSLCIGR